jgi:hypothetical protein
MDQQTVDKVLGFLREAAGQLGVGFEYAWPAVVRYMWAQALGTTLVLVFGLIMMWVLAIKAKNWLVAEDESIPDDSKDKGVPSIVALVILGSACIISGLILCSLAYWLPILIAPEGAAIMQLIGKATGK